MRNLVLVLFLAALAAAGGAHASSAPIVYRVTDAPEFFEPNDDCPAGGGVATMRSPGGRVIGTSRVCLQDVGSACDRVCVQQETGTLTNTFARGQIFLDVSFTYVFDTSFSRAIHSAVRDGHRRHGCLLGKLRRAHWARPDQVRSSRLHGAAQPRVRDPCPLTRNRISMRRSNQRRGSLGNRSPRASMKRKATPRRPCSCPVDGSEPRRPSLPDDRKRRSALPSAPLSPAPSKAGRVAALSYDRLVEAVEESAEA